MSTLEVDAGKECLDRDERGKGAQLIWRTVNDPFWSTAGQMERCPPLHWTYNEKKISADWKNYCLNSTTIQQLSEKPAYDEHSAQGPDRAIHPKAYRGW